MSIETNLKNIIQALPNGVSLVAVSKTKPNESILEAYSIGHRVFGENKIQEMVRKWEILPKDIQWHMIGHVQRNKVKYMAQFVSLVHGVDSFKLLKEINKQAKKHSRVIDCLFQIHIAEEDTKFGLDETELKDIIHSDEFQQLGNIKIVGLMGMATFTSDTSKVEREFKHLKSIFDTSKVSFPNISVLSMGMSGDYQIAIKEGSTMVRLGSSIFGARSYS